MQAIASHLPRSTGASGHEQHERQLQQIARAIAVRSPGARAALQQWLEAVQASEDPRRNGLYVFGAALAQRLAGRTAAQANLYLNQFELPQIELFNLLGRALPFVGMATEICNAAILSELKASATPLLIDVGIGTGRQVQQLLPALPAAGIRQLTVIGIEPSDWALQAAQTQLEAAARDLGLALHFIPLLGSVESLSQAQRQTLRDACAAQRPVINASFALHHIADDGEGQDQRQLVLQTLQALDPALLLLAEPDVDHLETELYPRFRNCFAHFSAVFATLDQLDLMPAERDALKVGFFGREIADILGQPEGSRSERHESAAQWLRRLAAAGFDVAVEASPPESAAGPVQLRRRAYHLSLAVGDEPVVALFMARPQHPLH